MSSFFNSKYQNNDTLAILYPSQTLYKTWQGLPSAFLIIWPSRRGLFFTVISIYVYIPLLSYVLAELSISFTKTFSKRVHMGSKVVKLWSRSTVSYRAAYLQRSKKPAKLSIALKETGTLCSAVLYIYASLWPV